VAPVSKSEWEIKVTSKGQITLPKQARDIMMVREGDHLQAVIKDDSLVLTRKVELTDSQRMKTALEEVLQSLGHTRGQANRTVDRRDLRKSLGPIPDLTRLSNRG
jgi:AbrB family looped-hinge helix DNA binding protein